MVFGWMLKVGCDTKGRRLLYIKSKDTYYLLPEKKEFLVTLWKHNEVNAISIGVILGYFIFKTISAALLIAALCYVVVLALMNFKLLPTLHRVNNKKITWRKEEQKQESNGLLPAILFLAIGAGLFICIAVGETHGQLEGITAALGGLLAIGMGLRQLYKTTLVRK